FQVISGDVALPDEQTLARAVAARLRALGFGGLRLRALRGLRLRAHRALGRRALDALRALGLGGIGVGRLVHVRVAHSEGCPLEDRAGCSRRWRKPLSAVSWPGWAAWPAAACPPAGWVSGPVAGSRFGWPWARRRPPRHSGPPPARRPGTPSSS